MDLAQEPGLSGLGHPRSLIFVETSIGDRTGTGQAFLAGWNSTFSKRAATQGGKDGSLLLFCADRCWHIQIPALDRLIPG